MYPGGGHLSGGGRKESLGAELGRVGLRDCRCVHGGNDYGEKRSLPTKSGRKGEPFPTPGDTFGGRAGGRVNASRKRALTPKRRPREGKKEVGRHELKKISWFFLWGGLGSQEGGFFLGKTEKFRCGVPTVSTSRIWDCIPPRVKIRWDWGLTSDLRFCPK